MPQKPWDEMTLKERKATLTPEQLAQHEAHMRGVKAMILENRVQQPKVPNVPQVRQPPKPKLAQGGTVESEPSQLENPMAQLRRRLPPVTDPLPKDDSVYVNPSPKIPAKKPSKPAS